MSGRVVAIGTAERKGEPLVARTSVRAAVAHGVVGDRYAEGAGQFAGTPDHEVTLVAEEDAEAAGVDALMLRRNIVTRGADLQSLVGRAFRIGDAVLHGIRPCLPCGYLERLLDEPGLRDRFHGGLRARVVHAGDIAVGDALEPADVVLDADMRAVVEAAHLAFVATVTPEGRPNLSPKGTIRVLDEHRLFFLEIASPQTRRNLATNAWMEVNVVDATSRRGWRFLGEASVHIDDETHRTCATRVFEEDGATYDDRGVVVLRVARALPLVSPGYKGVADEHAMRAAWREKRASLDSAFEKHVEKQGAFSLPRPGR